MANSGLSDDDDGDLTLRRLKVRNLVVSLAIALGLVFGAVIGIGVGYQQGITSRTENEVIMLAAAVGAAGSLTWGRVSTRKLSRDRQMKSDRPAA